MTAFGQAATGAITGTVTDQSGAVIANAGVEAKNTETGVAYPTRSTETGNYSLTQLPIGTYEISVSVTGFKSYVHSNLQLGAAQTIREDVGLEVGGTGDKVTVTAEASLLKTESADLTHNVTIHQLDNLPILPVNGGGLSSSSSGFRDPFSLTQLIPGTTYVASNTLVVNGAPSNTENVLIEGQTGNGLGGSLTHQMQPSVDAIQEVAVQTSNYAAEFGTAGGGIYNITMRSGTNQYHGTGYDYSVNDALNAAQPYTGLKSKQRRNDYGGTLGGPVRIPKLYNGSNRTFFFFNFEQYRENIRVTSTTATVPTNQYRSGDFSQVITGSGINGVPRNVQVGGQNYVDPLGRSVLSGQIFDPATTRPVTSNGQTIQVRDPFPGNKIPPTSFDPVALKVLALVPRPQGPNFLAGQLGNNYQNPWLSHRTSQLPSVKLDHTLSTKGHVSFYWHQTATESQFSFPNGNSVGLPLPIDPARGTFIYAPDFRVNYEHTLTPTLQLHFGVGYTANNFFDYAPVLNYNAQKELGLSGATLNRNFPNFNVCTGFFASCSVSTGGMSGLGPAAGIQSSFFTEHRPSANYSATWVRRNHTFKFGGEWRYEQYPTQTFSNTAGNYTFASGITGGSTSQVALQGVNVSQGSTGFGFADFLLGNVSSVTVAAPADSRNAKSQVSFFAQDSWKVTRKLTLDFGLRWDYGTYAKEQYGRSGNFNAATPNPSDGNLPGAQIFEATCNCNFASNYPYAIGPRVGFAYQLNSKTVIRGGVGIVYTPTSIDGGSITNSVTSPNLDFGQYLFQLKDGIPANVRAQAVWPVLTPSIGQPPNSVVGGPTAIDLGSGRPARQVQYSIGIQREVTRNLVLEASYVGNRLVWLPANGFGGAALSAFNVLSPDTLTRHGFTIGNLADSLLLRTISSNLTPAQLTTLASRGVRLPYPGYPTNQTVRQMLLPFPQYSSTLGPTGAPLGKTWYDSLQATVTKRLSHGLSLNANFTWSKTLALKSPVDIFNRALGKDLASSDLPLQFRLSAEYTVPRITTGPAFLKNRIVSQVLADWGLGWYSQYQSAEVLNRPASAGSDPISNYLGRGPGPAQTVDGQSLWSTDWTDRSGAHHTDPLDINCHCFDPTKTLVLNPKAWANVPNGQWAAQNSVIRDFRGFRFPSENMNVTRVFRIPAKDRVVLFTVRAEWQNVFNRLRLPQPSTGGFSANPTQSGGIYTGGFGTVVPISGTSGQRSGQVIARFQF